MLTARKTATFIFVSLLVIIIGAFIFEYAGYPPCELCLMQRWAYYVGIPFAGFMALAKPSWIKNGLLVLGLMLVANAIFGVYHSGVEWKFWAGPTACGMRLCVPCWRCWRFGEGTGHSFKAPIPLRDLPQQVEEGR